MSYNLYLRRKEIIDDGNWKSWKNAFPDLKCECMDHHQSMIPVRCSKCGADRTADNWAGNQSKVRCAYCTRFLECHEPDTETQHLDLIHCNSYQEVEALSQNQSSTTKEEK